VREPDRDLPVPERDRPPQLDGITSRWRIHFAKLGPAALLGDLDLVRWKQDLVEDKNRLATLRSAAKDVGPARDAKLPQRSPDGGRGVLD
jgi:hypothetical protein